MTRMLDSERRGPETADSVVVFLHGYGADGADLMGLAEPLAPYLPRTAFWAPDAPEICRNNPFGRQWFPIPRLDGSSMAEAAAGMAAAADDLDAFLDRVLVAEELPASRMAVVGFSQGTMMALHVVPRRAHPVAGIVGFSGRLLVPERLPREARSRSPVLLVHGDQDQMVPFDEMALAEQGLRAAGFGVEAVARPGLGHGIDPDGLAAAAGFLRACLQPDG